MTAEKVSRCDKCGEIARSIDAGFSPGLHAMGHDCGGTWREVTWAEAYAARFDTQSQATRFESAVLAVARELLPQCAIDVIDGDEPSAEYWAWLIAQHEAVEASEPKPPPVPAMPSPSLTEQIAAALGALKKRQAEQTVAWAAAYVSLGRALEHAARGDRTSALIHVEVAADVEYDLCGDCAATGKIEGAAER